MMNRIHVNVNGTNMDLKLPDSMDPLGFISREVEYDLGKGSGEDTELDSGVKVEYTYKEWTVTVERREL